MFSRNAVAGAVFGLAFGDAFGAPVEFAPWKEIVKQLGAHGRLDLPRSGKFTDDTQMAIAVARALPRWRATRRHEHLVTDLTRNFINWKHRDEPRAPGVTCMASIARAEQGRPWLHATDPDSKGCGANMRVLPVAFTPRFADVRDLAWTQSAITHGHPTALIASELTALAIRWAALGVDLKALPELLLHHLSTFHHTAIPGWSSTLAARWRQANLRTGVTECRKSLRDAATARDWFNGKGDVCRVVGDGWVAEEALAGALFFAARFEHDPVLAISEATRTGGDTDSIAAITGAIVGARHGADAFPRGWFDRIERRHDLNEVARELSR